MSLFVGEVPEIAVEQFSFVEEMRSYTEGTPCYMTKGFLNTIAQPIETAE